MGKKGRVPKHPPPQNYDKEKEMAELTIEEKIEIMRLALEWSSSNETQIQNYERMVSAITLYSPDRVESCQE